ADLIAFLRAQRQLDVDPQKTTTGPVALKPLAHLQFDELPVTTKGTPLEHMDPHRGEEGYYALRVVHLVGECDAYHPDGLLAWFCDYGVYGSWNGNRCTARAFPGASWSKIVANPAKYLDTQKRANQKVARYIEPWQHCEFKEGYCRNLVNG